MGVYKSKEEKKLAMVGSIAGKKKRQLLYCFFDDFESFSSRLLLQHKRNDKGFYSEIS